MSVVVLTYLSSSVALAVVSLLPGQDGSPTATDLAWGVASGLGGGFGALLLFRGLGTGSTAVVAPITATGAASIPVVVGLAGGDPVTASGVIGVSIGLVAIVMLSLTGDDGARPPSRTIVDRLSAIARRPGVTDALASGVGFGCFFVFIAQTSDSAGHWPLVGARGTSVVMFVIGAVVARSAVLPDAGSRGGVVLAGALDAVAAACFLASTREGLLSVGAVLASLYPAATIVLARVVDGERIVRRQLTGLALAALAVSLLAV